MDTLREALLLLRPRNAVPPILACMVGYYAAGPSQPAPPLFIGGVIVFLAHSYATLQNDLEDQVIDRANRRKSALLSGNFSVKSLQKVSYFLILSIVAAASLSPQYPVHLSFAVVFIGLAWAYNRPPLLLSHRPVGSITLLGMFFGAVPLLYGASLGGNALSAHVLILAVAWFLLRCSVSILKDYSDYSGDKQHHKQTFLIAYGPVRVAYTSLFASLSGYALLAGVLFGLVDFGKLWSIAAVTTLLAIYSLWLRHELVRPRSFLSADGYFHKVFLVTTLVDVGAVLCLTS